MTREEAIKTIRLTCPKISDSECDFETAMRFLIPELAESEDERIRKWIASYIHHGVFTEDEHPMALKAVEWLEKQKENPQSADSIPSDCVSDAKCEDRSPKHTDSFGTDIRDTPAYWKGWDDAMKQKEQKPVDDKSFEEWVDDWWKHHKVNNPDSYDKGDEIQFDERGFKNFCRGIKNMYAEQKRGDRFEEARKKYQVEWI